MIKYSIVIPTYNHCDDLLRPCIDSILEFTNIDEVELIISANGCVDNTMAYLNELHERFRKTNPELIKFVWASAPLGFSKATNNGIKIARGEYIVLFSNDVTVLPSAKHEWIERLVQPLAENSKIAITGVLTNKCKVSQRDFLLFFCVMMKRKLFDELGLLEEGFIIANYEDTEYCYRAEHRGYEIKRVSNILGRDDNKDLMIIDFPIWHRAEKTKYDKNLFDVNWEEVNEKNRRLFESIVKSHPITPPAQLSPYGSSDLPPLADGV